ncbi:Alpha/beta hydrolase family protein [Sulfurivirga caldicuralii]|uniref:Alpha/beta hydrolase family protein n=1 Tax=Sulfurivirga caldicuralii TaxID=364032 RepID=A0A1N6DWM7_9GAMM|nr:alpha/beta fold hydrolase [Sulfurivirga caldicuralii]SIN75113.1 Alpha/beta hydrolase family protein [Sulfurivirga caldicuralii]
MQRKYLPSFLLLFILLGTTFTSRAEVVQYKLPSNGLVAVADYTPGDTKRPAVLILHGLLTTNRFHTVRAMMETAQELGFGVLAPNLTYAIPRRNESVLCTSLHRHTLDMEAAEIHDWIDWLRQEGYPSVILVGHSAASQLFLYALKQKPRKDVSGLILTSLLYLNGPELGTRQAELDKARRMIEEADSTPQKWHWVFCRGNYLATPESYLSYTKLTRPFILQTLKEISARIPTYVVMGGADKRYERTGRNILDQYRQSGAHVVVIDGANHFFSSEHQFDLQDTLSDILETHAAP